MDKKWTRSTALFTASLLAALAGPLGAAQGRGEMAGAAARLADMAAEWGRNGPTPMIAESTILPLFPKALFPRGSRPKRLWRPPRRRRPRPRYPFRPKRCP